MMRGQAGEGGERFSRAPEMKGVHQDADILPPAGGDHRLRIGDSAQLGPGHRLKVHGQPIGATGRGEDSQVVGAALKVVVIAGD